MLYSGLFEYLTNGMLVVCCGETSLVRYLLWRLMFIETASESIL